MTCDVFQDDSPHVSLPNASPPNVMNSTWTRWAISSIFVQKYPSTRGKTRIFKALFVPTPQLAKMSADTRKRKFVGDIVVSKRKVQSATTKAGVADFFKPASEKEPEKTTWKLVANTLVVGKYLNTTVADEGSSSTPAQVDRKRIAGFDLVSPSKQ